MLNHVGLTRALPSLAGIASSPSYTVHINYSYSSSPQDGRYGWRRWKTRSTTYVQIIPSGRPACLFRSSRPGNGGVVTVGREKKKRKKKEIWRRCLLWVRVRIRSSTIADRACSARLSSAVIYTVVKRARVRVCLSVSVPRKILTDTGATW